MRCWKNHVRKLVKATGLVLAIVAGWNFLGDWFAPDACLDFGGSFDYQTWRCSYTDDHPYIDVPVYDLFSFWLFVMAVGVALTAFVWLRPRRWETGSRTVIR
jgi:hypothetical protein